MIEIVEKILNDDFVPYEKVYELAGREGLTKSQVKQAKIMLGVKTIILVNEMNGCGFGTFRKKSGTSIYKLFKGANL